MLYQNISLSSESKSKWRSNLLEKGYAWHVSGELLGHAGLVIGVDPGVNFGITVINECYIHILNGKLRTLKERRIEYAILSHDLIHEIMHEFGSGGRTPTLILEGAAFNKTFGQVNLAEVRTGYYMAMRSYGEVEIPAPMSVRKAVFGDGRIQPMDIYPHLNHNAADSLSIALYGLR